MAYIKMRYVVIVMIALPLTMNGMMTQQMRRKAVVLQKRSFFKNNNDFYKLIDDPQFSLVDAEEMIAKEISSASSSGDALCRSDIADVQGRIVATALKYKNVTTLLQPQFERVEQYNSNLNNYSADEQYAYLLTELHYQMHGRVCACNNWKKTKAWSIARENNLKNIVEELNYFAEIVAREE
jgi:hypothetical protein